LRLLRALATRSDRRHISALCKKEGNGLDRPTPNNSFNRG
jgi:hypothetical protein